jgi:hypothetical protein
MIAEALEYYLQDLEESYFLDVAQKVPQYGVDRFHLIKEYHGVLNENEELQNLVIKLLRHIKNRTQNLYPDTGVSKELNQLYIDFEIE